MLDIYLKVHDTIKKTVYCRSKIEIIRFARGRHSLNCNSNRWSVVNRATRYFNFLGINRPSPGGNHI